MGFVKGFIRTGVIVALTGGAAVVVAEVTNRGSTKAVLSQAKDTARSLIDLAVDDPVALRSQLERLEAEYPARIAAVRDDLRGVTEQVADLERERDISDKVVTLASADLAQIDAGIAEARAYREANPHAVVRIAFEDRRMRLDDAYGARTEIEQTRDVYANRGDELETELSYLRDQQERLADLLAELETERSQFQAQIVQLDAQIESIARNERLIAMMEQRQRRIDELSRYEAHSLEQFERRVSRVRLDQQERLAQLSADRGRENYEDLARWELDQSDAPADQDRADEAEVITIDPGEAAKSGGSMASRR